MHSKLDALAHDLRAPLTALKIASGLLAIRWPIERDSSAAALIDALQSNIARLERIADELTALADRECVPASGAQHLSKRSSRSPITPRGRQKDIAASRRGRGNT